MVFSYNPTVSRRVIAALPTPVLPAPDIPFPATQRTVTFDDIRYMHTRSRGWETTTKVLCKRWRQTRDGQILSTVLADTTGQKIEAIAVEQFADRCNNELQIGRIYVFKRVGFAHMPLSIPLVLLSHYIIILDGQTEIRLAEPHQVIPQLPPWFIDFRMVYGLRNKMLTDVIGMVVHVTKYMYKKSFHRNIPCLDIGIINIRREIIFIRVWDQHVVRDITRWVPAQRDMWTLAATMLEVNRAEGGLSTTYESEFVFRPHNQLAQELEASRATFVAAQESLSHQVRDAVELRSIVAMNENLCTSTL